MGNKQFFIEFLWYAKGECIPSRKGWLQIGGPSPVRLDFGRYRWLRLSKVTPSVISSGGVISEGGSPCMRFEMPTQEQFPGRRGDYGPIRCTRRCIEISVQMLKGIYTGIHETIGYIR